MSTTTTHPTQIVLPGQTAAPDGPIDMMMMYLMHHAFRRDLRKFAGAVPHTPVDELETWRALHDRWTLFSELLHKHHSGEDAGIWPFLLERADADERATLDAMEAEHEKIDPLLQSCGALLEQLASQVEAVAQRPSRGRSELRAGLAVRLSEAQELLAHHLRHEETGAIPLIQKHITLEDWERIENENFQEKQSLGFLKEVVSWIAEDIPAEHFPQIFRTAGQGFRVIWWIGRGGFRRRSERAFRHLPTTA